MNREKLQALSQDGFPLCRTQESGYRERLDTEHLGTKSRLRLSMGLDDIKFVYDEFVSRYRTYRY